MCRSLIISKFAYQIGIFTEHIKLAYQIGTSDWYIKVNIKLVHQSKYQSKHQSKYQIGISK